MNNFSHLIITPLTINPLQASHSTSDNGQSTNKLIYDSNSTDHFYDELTAIVTIYNQAILTKTATAELTPVSVADKKAWFDEHINKPNRPIYVVRDTKAIMDVTESPSQLSKAPIIAWGCFSDLYPRPAYHISAEISIYLDHSYQKQGLGTYLTTWMMQQANLLGIEQIIAKVFAHNLASLAMFKNLGFTQWGYLPKVCDMEGFVADVVILGCEVTQILLHLNAQPPNHRH